MSAQSLENFDREEHFKENSHGSSLLFRNSCVLLLHHTQPANGQLQLHLELGLSMVSTLH